MVHSAALGGRGKWFARQHWEVVVNGSLDWHAGPSIAANFA